MKVSEIFYSLQGEGARAGTANIFIRLSGCSAKHACYALGVRCDTEFESGTEYSMDDLLEYITNKYPKCHNIIWTGGEPLDQLTKEVVDYFKDYFQAVETSGLKTPPPGLDYICISPKVAEHVLAKSFKGVHVHELRYVRHKGQSIPKPALEADSMYLSPHSDGWNINRENVNHCIQLVKDNPTWKLSVQQHKIWTVL